MGTIRKLSQNKFFYIFAILIILMFPSALYMQSDKDTTIVITTIGIDGSDEGYSVTTLAVIPNGSTDNNVNLEVFSGKGENITDALNQVSLETGKKIGLAHCDCIIVTQELFEDNATRFLDYFIRTANLTTNATLVACEGSAKDLIEATKSSNNILDLSLKNIVMFQEKMTMLENVTIENFYKDYYTHASTFALPVLSTVESDSESGDSQASGSGGESTNSSQSKQKKIKNDSKVIVLKNGKYLTTLTQEEKDTYNLLSPSSESLYVKIDDVNDENFTNTTLVVQQIDKIVIPHCSFEDGKPVMEYNIVLSIMLDEAVSEYNYSYDSINGFKNDLTNVVMDKINNKIQSDLSITNEKMRSGDYDIMNLYGRFNAYKYRKFQKYLDSLENPEMYMENMTIKINLKLNFVI